MHDVPVANALVTAPREREQSGKVALPEWYYAIQQENQQWQNERRGFRKDYLSGDSAAKAQWERLEGDVISVDGKYMSEASYIKSQGNVPLKNNIIRRLVRNVLGVYRSQSKEPTCTARDRDEQRLVRR